MRRIIAVLLFIHCLGIIPVSFAQDASGRKEGFDHACQGRFDEARKWFKKRLQTHKGDNTSAGALAVIQDLGHDKISREAAVSFFKGLCFLEDGKRQEGLKELEETARIAPGYARTYNVLGVVNAAGGQTEKAAECFQKAIAENPAYGEAYFNLAALQHSLGQSDAAMKNYKTALDLTAGSVDVLTSLAALSASQGKYEDAIRYYEDALKKEAVEPDIYYNLALVYFMSDQFAKFESNLARAQELYSKRNDAAGLEKVGQYLSKIEELKKRLKK